METKKYNTAEKRELGYYEFVEKVKNLYFFMLSVVGFFLILSLGELIFDFSDFYLFDVRNFLFFSLFLLGTVLHDILKFKHPE